MPTTLASLLLSALLGAYQPVPGISGAVRLVGSDTLAALTTGWSDAFRAHYPAVIVEVQAAGSSSAPPALAEATADIGTMSRRLTAQELAGIAGDRGVAPVEVVIGQDAVAVVVHRENALPELTLAELDAVFSATRLCAARPAVRLWRDLGRGGELADRPLDLFGRNAASGTYAFFRDAALCGGIYRRAMEELPGSGAIVSLVAQSRAGIGYVGLPYVTPEVRAVPIVGPDGRAVPPTMVTTATGRYPLSRPLYLYLGRSPGSRPAPAVREFIRFALSEEGRAITTALGFVPPPPDAAAETLRRFEAALAAP